MFERNVIIADFDQHKLARARKNKARVASRSASYIGCFHQDAMVSTTRGRVAVKDLCETDRVFTRDNGFQPIKFLGQQYSSGEQTVASVKIAAHAIAPSMPSVDVVLSSDQHVLLVTPSQSEFGNEQLVHCFEVWVWVEFHELVFVCGIRPLQSPHVPIFWCIQICNGMICL